MQKGACLCSTVRPIAVIRQSSGCCGAGDSLLLADDPLGGTGQGDRRCLIDGLREGPTRTRYHLDRCYL